MKRWIVAISLVAGLMGTTVLFAQQPGPIGEVIRVEPITGHTTQFEEAYKSHLDWHRQQNDDWTWDCWEYIAGPYTGQYAIIAGGHNWADFARGEMGAADRANAVETVMPHIGSRHVLFSQILPELSSQTMAGPPPPLATVAVYTIKPGMTPQFLAAVKKMHTALEAADWNQPYIWIEVAQGAEGGDQFYVVSPKNDWVDFEDPDKSLLEAVEEQLGHSETAELGRQFWSTVMSRDRHVVAYRSDLSYRP